MSTPPATSLMFLVDGQPTPADDCTWYEIAPCGCYCGAMLAVVGDTVYALEEQVWKHHYPNAELRRRQVAAGFTMRLDLRARVVELLTIECPHTPKWGVQATPVPDGYAWFREDGYRKRGPRKHLVPESAAEWRSGERPVALCGIPSNLWRTGRHLTNGVPECTRCQKAANAGAGGSGA